MKKRTVFLLFLMIVISAACSGSMAKSGIPDRDYGREGQNAPGESSYEIRRDRSSVARKLSQPRLAKQAMAEEMEAPSQPQTGDSQVQNAPKRIYTARLSLEVRFIKESRNQVLEIMKDAGGFLESQSETRVVIRVPSAHFDTSVRKILQLGRVLDKRISTYDVSDRYADMEKRLEIARKAKERLLELLKRVKKVEEKVRIIEEIQRLTREIESYQKQLSALDSFIDYSLIEIFLKTPQSGRIEGSSTPFNWINSLTPERFTLNSVKEIRFTLPDGFVHFDQENTYLARTPGGSFIRMSRTRNNPAGDSLFWKKALENGFLLKNYEKLDEGTKEKLHYISFKYQTLKPFYYLVALEARGDDIYILEGYFPDEKERAEHLDRVIEKLSEVKF
jgi:hypothetical protein